MRADQLMVDVVSLNVFRCPGSERVWCTRSSGGVAEGDRRRPVDGLRVNVKSVEFEAGLRDWSGFRTMTGDASFVPVCFMELVSQGSEDDAMDHYRDLENSVFVQGQLFEAAEPTMVLAMAALASDPPPHVRTVVLELIFQIANGVAHGDVIGRGDLGLVQRRRDSARRGILVLHRGSLRKTGEQALDVVDLIEGDRSRPAGFRDVAARSWRS
ncbi:hypothetical protein [Nocardiopsis sp. CA-288880]|uniref:hypothetical protein n=1 Tax=Nocardiopsis sp. CA-288880 TaxID=3239995 RepID=UPI003D98B7C4